MALGSGTKKGIQRTVALIGSVITTFFICVFIAPIFFAPIIVAPITVSANPIENLELPARRPLQRQLMSPENPASKQPDEIPKKIEIPDQWTMAEIEKARNICAPILSEANAEFELLGPIRKGPCGTPAPIKLKALGASVRVKISPPASLNCNMVRALNQWLNGHVQPEALASFGSNVIEIRNISSYSCRHRYNNPTKRLSEHALANALDIAGLKLANGKYVSLLNHWGETNRDRKRILARAQAQAAKAQAQAKTKAEAKAHDETKARAEAKARAAAKIKTADASGPTSPARLGARAANGDKVAAAENGAKANPPEWKAAIKKGRTIKASVKLVVPPKAPLDGRARFLRKLHTDACGIFGTVLGPEANEAHRNHYHFDLAPRRRSAYCQ